MVIHSKFKPYFLNVTISIAAFLLLCSCGGSETRIQERDLLALKKKYNAAVLNYFYETVFHTDFSRSNIDNLSKWTEDPVISIKGYATSADSMFVREAISEVNGLGLPLKCRLAAAGDSSSIEIFFGTAGTVASYLDLGDLSAMGVDTSSHFGFGRIDSNDGIFTKGRIGICFSPQHTATDGRRKVVLEELAQGLGILGDSYSYPASLFFQNSNPHKQFTDLDKQLLQLLYEPSIPPNYARSYFEEDFADSLYMVNTNEKLMQHFRRLLADSSLIRDVEETFTGDTFFKHPKEVGVFLYGDYTDSDSAIIAAAATALSAISPNLKVFIAKHEASEPDHGIVISFKDDRSQKQAVLLKGQTLVGKSCMNQKIIKNKIDIVFNLTKRSAELRPKSLVDVLYFSLVPMKQTKARSDQLCTISEGKISFNKHYADLIRIIYANEFVDGYNRKAFGGLTSSLNL